MAYVAEHAGVLLATAGWFTAIFTVIIQVYWHGKWQGRTDNRIDRLEKDIEGSLIKYSKLEERLVHALEKLREDFAHQTRPCPELVEAMKSIAGMERDLTHIRQRIDTM